MSEDSLMRRSALASVYAPGVFGADAPPPGVTLYERRPLAVLHLSLRAGEGAARKAASDAFGLTLPEKPGTAAEQGARCAMPVAPNEWLLTAADTGGESAALADTLANAAGGAGAVNDVSQGRVVIRIGGPAARDVLAKACPVDLHPRAFGENACAVTVMAHVTAAVRRVGGGDEFDIYAARGFALHFWQWLTRASAEYGYEVRAPGA